MLATGQEKFVGLLQGQCSLSGAAVFEELTQVQVLQCTAVLLGKCTPPFCPLLKVVMSPIL